MDENSDGAIFKILPRYKVRSEGDEVGTYINYILMYNPVIIFTHWSDNTTFDREIYIYTCLNVMDIACVFNL